MGDLRWVCIRENMAGKAQDRERLPSISSTYTPHGFESTHDSECMTCQSGDKELPDHHISTVLESSVRRSCNTSRHTFGEVKTHLTQPPSSCKTPFTASGIPTHQHPPAPITTCLPCLINAETIDGLVGLSAEARMASDEALGRDGRRLAEVDERLDELI